MENTNPLWKKWLAKPVSRANTSNVSSSTYESHLLLNLFLDPKQAMVFCHLDIDIL